MAHTPLFKITAKSHNIANTDERLLDKLLQELQLATIDPQQQIEDLRSIVAAALPNHNLFHALDQEDGSEHETPQAPPFSRPHQPTLH
jgi:hypothetical protein